MVNKPGRMFITVSERRRTRGRATSSRAARMNLLAYKNDYNEQKQSGHNIGKLTRNAHRYPDSRDHALP